MGTLKVRGLWLTARLVTAVAAVAIFWTGLAVPLHAQTKIRVGRTISASGFHIPSYIAQERGMFKEQGFTAEFIATQGGALVRAGIAKEIDYVPIPGGGSQAMLRGAPIVFVVGESLISQWTITTQANIKTVADLRGKTIGVERPGSAPYEETVVTLGQFFKMEAGKDYKLLAFTAEADRVAALIAGSIDAAILSFGPAAAAEQAGMKILLKTGDYIPRLGGTFWVHKDRIRERRDEVKRFIKAIGRAADYIRTNREGTIEVIMKYFPVIKERPVAEIFYKQIQNAFGPEIPRDLLKVLFESRLTPEAGWPAGKPAPDLEQFVARDILNETLKEMGRKPSK
ncbi:MAG: ABC transporter substrate-binding protein [Deltaproteobacteria bacterium]|nr:ABC transporter substrate-binding protein [Deltaproteobacteria bacterium]